MDEVIWIEILSRQLAVIARHRCIGNDIRIGRGYANDIVLDDPLVAADHLRITRDASGALHAEDLGSANGLFIGNGKERLRRVAIDGEHPLRIGHTFLRIREPGYHVAPETTPRHWGASVPAIAALALAAIVLPVLMQWLNETDEPRFSTYLQPLLGVPALALIWAALWSLLCRIFSSHARFARNLLIALSGLVAYSVLSIAIHFVAFTVSWRPLATYQYAGVWIFLAVLCLFHLREISPARLSTKAGALAALAALAIAAETVIQSDTNANVFTQRSYNFLLMPPALRLVPAKSDSAFFTGIEKLKQKLDQDRADSAAGD